MTVEAFPVPDMLAHVRAGRAEALMETSAPPVLFDGRWWTVRADLSGERYRVVQDPQVLAVLEDGVRRVRAARSSDRRG